MSNFTGFFKHIDIAVKYIWQLDAKNFKNCSVTVTAVVPLAISNSLGYPTFKTIGVQITDVILSKIIVS
jgi:hypothetical protein